MTVKRTKIVAGFGWIALITYSNKVIGFVTTLILAKLLAPEDFGLVAIASMLIQVLYIFKDMGLSQALIYRKGEMEKAGSTAFWLVIGFNLIIFFFAVLISPFAASFYENSLVMPVIILLSSNLIWNSIRAVPTSLISKDIDFNKLVIPNVVPVVLGSIVGIIMAFEGYGVWSLVVRSLIVSSSGMLLIWKFTLFRPSFTFDMKTAIELLSYGKYIVGSSVFVVVLFNIDKLYVSKIEGIAVLGFYVLAMRIANLPVSEFSHLVGAVMFPVLSKMNEDMNALQGAFLKTLRYSSMISIPMAIGISTYGPALIQNIYGDKWLPMALPLQMISLYAMFRSLSTIIHDTFKAIGQPNLIQRFMIIRLVCVGILGIPALKLFGLTGICLLIVGTYLLAFVFEAIKICELLSLSLLVFLQTLAFPLLLSALLIPGIYWILSGIFESIYLGQIILGIGLTIFCYFLSICFFQKAVTSEVRSLIFSKT